MSSSTNVYKKLPKTPQEHITQLEGRGLVIPDHERAERYLSHIGYYRLSAYFIPFEEPILEEDRSHQFKEGTSFNQVLNLYIFDRKLRMLVMEAIERIEVSIRSNWANSITVNSNNAHAYMDSTLFKSPWTHHKNLSQVVSKTSESIELFVKHYKRKYSEPFLLPTWAMVETLTFGQVSKWYSDTKSTAIKKETMRALGMPTIEVAESVMHSLSLIRNICAHHGRLWNRRFVKQLPRIRNLQEFIVLDDNQPSRKLYNYLLVIDHLMNTIQPNTSWSKRFEKLINTELPRELHKEMGMPKNWLGFPTQV